MWERHLSLASAGLLFLVAVGCAGRTAISPSRFPVVEKPVEIEMSRDAGRGDALLTRLTVGDEKELLLFAIDTGSPVTILDNSLRPLLGEQIGTKSINYPWYGKAKVGIFRAPRLRVKDLELQLSGHVLTDDLNRIAPGRGLKGLLGMDCLKHYQVQLDFPLRKIRVLPSGALALKSHRAIPISISRNTCSVRMKAFGKEDVRFLLDTGNANDGTLSRSLFEVIARAEAEKVQIKRNPTHERVMFLTESEMDGLEYRELIFFESPPKSKRNALGLRFFARHDVIFDFPGQMMYLGTRQPSED